MIPSLLRRVGRWPLVRFGLIGASGIPVDLVVLHLWQAIVGPAPYSGQILGWFAATSSNWWLNRHYTFRDRPRRPPVGEWLGFVAVNATGGSVCFLIYALLIGRYPVAAAHPVLAVLAGAIGGLAFNFGFSSLLVFRPARDRASDPR